MKRNFSRVFFLLWFPLICQAETVRISSNPSGVTVKIDGVVTCTSPCEGPLTTPTPTPLASPIDPATLNPVAALWMANKTARLWRDESPAHNDAHAVGAAFQFAQPVSVRTAMFIVKHRTGLQVSTALLSNSAANGYEFSSGEYKHEGSFWDYPYATLTSNTSPAILGGRLWINGLELSNPILAPKPRAMEAVVVESTANISVDTLLSDRLYPGRVWDGDVCGIVLFNRKLSDAERDGVTAYAQARCALPALPPLLAFYGDSITYGVTDWTAENCLECAYPYQVTQQLNSLGIVADAVEFGVGSQTMQTVLDDFDVKTAPLLADRRRTRIVVLQGGGNGLLSYPGTAQQQAAALFQVTVAIAARVHTLGGKIVVTTMTPSNPTYLGADELNRVAFEAARQAYNSLVRSSASFDAINDAGADPKLGCPTCADSQSPSGYQNALYRDGTHPNKAGDAILASGAARAVMTLLPRPNKQRSSKQGLRDFLVLWGRGEPLPPHDGLH